MREQRFAVVGIKLLQRLPEIFGLFGQGFFPRAMPRGDRRGGGKIGKAREGRCQRVFGFDLQARVGRVVVEEPQRQRMQHGEKGHAGIIRKRVAQGEGVVSRQLDHQPVGQGGRIAIFILCNLRDVRSAVEIRGAAVRGRYRRR